FPSREYEPVYTCANGGARRPRLPARPPGGPYWRARWGRLPPQAAPYAPRAPLAAPRAPATAPEAALFGLHERLLRPDRRRRSRPQQVLSTRPGSCRIARTARASRCALRGALDGCRRRRARRAGWRRYLIASSPCRV